MLPTNIFALPNTYCRFSDRDLMMRFRGGGVGHKSTREATDFFRKDRDRLDMAQSNIPASENNEDGPVKQEDLEMEDDIDEDEEEDFGYIRDESEESEGEPEPEVELAAQDEDDDFGPEDDGGVIDPDMMGELGYSSL
jgi:hypothetical protein